jgi:hypothetical protein
VPRFCDAPCGLISPGNPGHVLDVRTCVVLNDRDGDPRAVLSPEGWAAISDENKALLDSLGVTVTTN